MLFKSYAVAPAYSVDLCLVGPTFDPGTAHHLSVLHGLTLASPSSFQDIGLIIRFEVMDPEPL